MATMTPKPPTVLPVADAAAQLVPRGVQALRALTAGPKNVAQLARELRRPPAKVARGLDALVALGAVKILARTLKDGTTVDITERGRDILSHAEQPRIA